MPNPQKRRPEPTDSAATDGIYIRRTSTVRDTDDLRQALGTLRSGGLAERLVAVKVAALEVLAPFHCADAPPHALRSNWADGLPDHERERVKDALSLLLGLDSLAATVLAGNAQAAATWGLTLGSLYERLGVRPHEPHVVRGKRVLRGAKAGHSETHGPPEETAQRHDKIRAVYARCDVERIGKMATYRRLAREFNTSVATVRRVVAPPKRDA